MLQFKRGLAFPTILSFVIYFMKKKVKLRERPFMIHPQQAELAMHVQQMQRLDFRCSGEWI